MIIHAIGVGLARTPDGKAEIPVGEMRWRSPDLPSRALFVEAVVQLFERIDLPSFPARAWVELDTHDEVKRCEVQLSAEEPGAVARVLWAYAVTVFSGEI